MGDIWAQLANHRKTKTLPDGSRLLLRPLSKDDKAALVDLFARAPAEELKYFRDDAADAAVVESWVDNLDDERGHAHIVGDATLRFRERYHRHLAWVRIFLDGDYRRRGIGTLILRSLIEIARTVGLQQLYTEVVSTQHDCFVTSEGETLDMSVFGIKAGRPFWEVLATA